MFHRQLSTVLGRYQNTVLPFKAKPIDDSATQHPASHSIHPPPTPPTTLLLIDAPIAIELWALISEDPSKAVDPGKLAALLFDLGLSRADELGYCDSAMWADLAAHLKPIPKRKLLHILAKNNISVGNVCL